MDAKKHDEIMVKIMNELDKDNLSVADGISLWHSLGTFLFSSIDKENKDVSVIYTHMKNYLNDMEKMKLQAK